MNSNTNILPDHPLIVDPPSGWQYGFPKRFTFKASSVELTDEEYNEELTQWYLEQGYPQVLIDEGMLNYVRYWSEH